jgi:rhamnosyltransferase subunit B
LPPAAPPLFEGQHSEKLVLAMFSRVLGSPQPDWPVKTRQTGFAFYDGDQTSSHELDSELNRFMDDGPAPIIFTLGSTA